MSPGAREAPADWFAELCGRLRALRDRDPATSHGLVSAVLWWSVSRDHEGVPKAERLTHRRILKALTDASRIVGGLEFARIRRRQPEAPA